ncbi:MAG: protein-L-isoaspartate O-methyltransferase [Alphaproteobacteria bacterium]|nr:protein-L-isoaspartate O-methyltransferase [Alphaproteobacteria bacterium]MDE2340456.1 protein-L-isoaspartate O-methyltransferase [Alphaproteobacteria bacterium]
MTNRNFDALREAMIDSQLRTSGINDPAVLAAFRKVAREHYVPEALRALAYIDRPIELGDGRALNPPETVGHLISEVLPRHGDLVLVVGMACDYTAALLRAMGAEVDVAAPDILPDHAAHYDVIIIDGALPELPGRIVELLKSGGRLAMALTVNSVTHIMRGSKSAGGFGMIPVADIDAIPLPVPDPKPRFVFA